jgi:hypothetical protein
MANYNEIENNNYIKKGLGQDSAGSIATHYRLDSLRIKSQWGQDIPHPPRQALGTTQSPIQWVSSISWG